MPAAQYAREKAQRYRLAGAKCTACGQVAFPPRPACSGCRATAFEPVRLSGEGRVLTWTVVHVAPSSFAMQTPYVLAVVELSEGVRITAQIADVAPEALEVGIRVRHVFRRLSAEGEGGILRYGYKFVLDDRARGGGRSGDE